MNGWEEMVKRLVKLVAVAGLAAAFAGCGGGGAGVMVTVSPTVTTVVLSGTQQFSAVVNGSSNQNVTWSVNTVKGGNSTVGTISTSGLFTAPATLPSPVTVTVTAASVANPKASANATVTLDSGVRVTVDPLIATIGTGEKFSFAATVTGTNNINVTWSVSGVPGGNMTVGKIDSSGNYTAPTTVPSPSTITVTATSVADNTHLGNSSVTIATAADPRLTSMDPTTAAQGSVFQDIYLTGPNSTGTDFFSTNTVVANGTPISTTFLSTTVLRARIPDALLAVAGPLAIAVQRQNGDVSAPPLILTVNPVRPTIISSTPASAPQNGASFTASLDGGFYGTATLPAVTAEFNGQLRIASPVNTRQLKVNLQGPDLLEAGLFPLVVRNSSVPASSPAIAATNLAVEPPASAISPAPTATFPVGTQPTAIAVNTATRVAVVANRGDNTISVIDLAASTVQTLPVGTGPTGVAVDNIRNTAAVVNNGSNTLSIVSLGPGAPAVIGTLTLPSATTAYSIGLNPLTGRALVANVSTNSAVVVDLSIPSAPAIVGTVTISTGPTPAVTIEPRLDWALVTPGGSGALAIVNLGRPSSTGDLGLAPFVVATASLSTNLRGIAINTETEQALFTDPLSSLVTTFSVLDQTISPFVLDKGEVAAAINPLTNIAVVVNSLTNQATVLDLRTPSATPTTIPVGTAPQAVAIDPVTNQALVASTGSGPGTVSVLSLGSLRPLHITQISPPTAFTAASPCAGAPPLKLQLIGGGFNSGSVVRLDEAALPLADVTFTSARQLTASIPACMVSSPRLFAVDVQNPDGTISNEDQFTVMGAIPVGTAPQGVAIDTDHELAVVTNSGEATISIVDLKAGTASTPLSVGANPQGVAVLPRLGLAVVANNGGNSASIVDVVKQQIVNTVNVGSGPLGVAIHPNTAVAFVANSLSNSVSTINLGSAAGVGSIPVDQRPVAVAIDPIDNLAAVTTTTQGTVVIIDTTVNFLKARVSGMNIPLGVAFDPVGDVFLALNSSQNNLVLIDPNNPNPSPALVGINPTSIDYNSQTSTLVTANFLSHTLTVMDYQNLKPSVGSSVPPPVAPHVAALLSADSSTQFGVAIDPTSNLAVVVDTNNNHILLIPLPR